MPASRATWDANFGTGLRTSYDFTIFMAQFGTDISYMNGEQYLLILTGVDEDNQDATEMLSLGDGWESKDGGFTVVHDKKAQVNRNSAYGKWCAFAADCKGTEIFYDKDPLDASIWANTRWRMQEVAVWEAFTPRGSNETVPARMRLMPVEFLGFVSDGDSPPAVASAEPSAEQKRVDLLARASAASPVLTAAQNGIAESPGTPTPIDQLIALAKSNDFSGFVNAALALDFVLSDDKLAESVIDSGANGFYTLNHG